MKKKWLVLLCCVALACCLVTGCGSDNTDADGNADNAVVKVGFMGPITGSASSEGTAARNAFEMAFKQVNESGTLPYKIEVVALDDAGNAETGASAAQKLTAENDMVAISGHFNSPVADATIPICKQAEIPLVIWGAIREDLTNSGNYPLVTRVAPTDKQENTPLSKSVVDLGYKNFYIISDTSSYGTANTETFQAEVAKYAGCSVLGVDEVTVGTTDFRAILTKIKALDVDAIYCGSAGGTEVGSIKTQMAELGMDDVLLFGISGIAVDDFITVAGDKAEGTVANKPGIELSKTEAGQKFLAAYDAAGYSDPVGAFSVYAYDAAQVIIAAMQSIDGVPTAEQMIDAIAAVNTTGVLGAISFDEIGQTTNSASHMVVVQDGAWISYEDSEYADGTRKLAGQQ